MCLRPRVLEDILLCKSDQINIGPDGNGIYWSKRILISKLYKDQSAKIRLDEADTSVNVVTLGRQG